MQLVLVAAKDIAKTEVLNGPRVAIAVQIQHLFIELTT